MPLRPQIPPRSMTLRPQWPLLALAGVLLMLLAGCAGLDGAGSISPERARELVARGEYRAAASDYERLAARAQATADEEGFQRYTLDAATAWIDAARAVDAERVLEGLTPPRYSITLSAERTRERELLRARSAALAGDAGRAWALFNAIKAPTDVDAYREYLRLRQSFAVSANKALEAVRAAKMREAQVAAEQVAALRRELLAQLREAIERGARFDPRTAAKDTIARGWLEAAPLAARAAQLPAGTTARILADWRKRYPGHPATEALTSTHRDAVPPAAAASSAPSVLAPSSSAAPTKSSAHVAALLPLSGRNTAAGKQLRDGLLAAYYRTPSADRLPLHFYDTQGTAITEVLQRAERAGAVFVIGPLARDEVNAAAEDLRALPTLALNFLTAERTAARANFYQFALSPEEEARAIARHALAQGQRRAVALVPAGEWGDRVLGAFESELQQGGGTLIAKARLVGEESSAEIEQALRLDQSRARHRRLQSILNIPLAFQPRRRGDIDVLFVPGNASALRALRPQLRFHGAADIPAYTTSDAWDGRATSELIGLVFPDTRWMLDANESTTLALRESARASFGSEHDRHRLFAFAHDAWLLQQQLRRRPDANLRAGAVAVIVEGATGRLELDAEGRVQRSLEWGEFIDGGVRLAVPIESGREP